MGEIHSHRDLLAWQKSMDLGQRVYEVTGRFPDAEKYGLTAQLRRAAVSVPSNIAEGYGRGSTADYVRFLRAARGSLYEIDTQLLFASRLGIMSQDQYVSVLEQINECGRILAALIRSLEIKEEGPRPLA